jgi:hypothetical protein
MKACDATDAARILCFVGMLLVRRLLAVGVITVVVLTVVVLVRLSF